MFMPIKSSPRHNSGHNSKGHYRGFTLVETIIAIAILGVVAVISSTFIAGAFNSYFSSVRRAEMVTTADVAVQRLAREVKLAVPNSLRMQDSAGNIPCSTGTCYIEFVPTKSGGTYRNNGDGSTAGNFLCNAMTGTINTTFDVLGPGLATTPAIAANDFIVIDNDANLPSGTDVYGAVGSGSRTLILTASLASPNSMTISSAFTTNSTIICNYQNNRYQVIDQNIQAVTYSCPMTTPGAITRYAAYGFNSSQITSGLTGGVTVAGNTTYPATCTATYNANAQERNGILSFAITITSGGETITVFRQIHVDNSP